MSAPYRGSAGERRGRILGVALIGLAAAAVAPTGRLPEAMPFLAFVGFTAVGELLDLPRRGPVLSTLGLAPVIGFALLGHHPAEVFACYLAGALLASPLRRLAGAHPRLPAIGARAAVATLAAGAYWATPEISRINNFGPAAIAPAGFAAMVAVVLVAGPALEGLLTAVRDRIPLLPVTVAALAGGWALNLSVVSVGALLALAYPALGGWSFPLFLAPLAATQYSFRQLSSIKTTYLQTIRALSRVPEMAGYSRPGHSGRVAELSVAIAREMGLAQTDEIEYAALLHDIGRVSMPDNAPDAEAVYRAELATAGARIVEQTGHFPSVADTIRRQYEPYRRRGEETTADLPAGARIIKVASAYDDLVRPDGVGLSAWDALDRLHLGMAYEYEPTVVQALTRVLEKRGAI